MALSDLRGTIEELLAAGRVPGAVVACARGDGPADVMAVGADADGRAVRGDSLLPVASITKRDSIRSPEAVSITAREASLTSTAVTAHFSRTSAPALRALSSSIRSKSARRT